uniref:uncharacterized protein LOC131136197 isoform X2 n=1 Tax=Doryrhamphus excisus TaxID=161450 RepID=UPI0025AE1957|nr:uncharacterized protein LOC131136197 isoform X2 [Doryrhamphus excisus]
MTYQQVLVYFLAVLVSVSAVDVEYYLKGQEIRLAPSIFGKPDGILWMHDWKEVVYVKETGVKETVFSPYENKIILNQSSAELTIKNATYEDSGNYDQQVLINKKVHAFQYRIEIIDKVPKPDISCFMSDTKQAMLVCSADSKNPGLLAFKWSSRGKETIGPNVRITIRNEDDDQVYRCDVSNPLTNEMASFTAKDCFLDKRSAALSVTISVIFVVVIVLLIILACIFHKRLRGSACMENTNKCVFKTHRRAAEGSSQGDETVFFLDGASTLPSNQRIDPSQGGEKKMDSSALNGSNKDLTAEDKVESDTADLCGGHSPLTSTDKNTTELEDTSKTIEKSDNFILSSDHTIAAWLQFEQAKYDA